MFAWLSNLFSGGARKELERVVEDLQNSVAALKQTEDELVEQIQKADTQVNRAQMGAMGNAKMQREQMLFQLQENRATQKHLQARLQDAQGELKRLT